MGTDYYYGADVTWIDALRGEVDFARGHTLGRPLLAEEGRMSTVDRSTHSGTYHIRRTTPDEWTVLG